LQVLGHLDRILARRQEVDAHYRARLKAIPGIQVPALPPPNVRFNYAYFPVEIDQTSFGMSRDQLYETLKQFNIHTRRYFHPLITDFACYRSLSIRYPLTTARTVAGRILTLPIYDSLALEDVGRICDIIEHVCPVKARVSKPRRRASSRAGKQNKPPGS
jgi:dTDP-4-amino-4,6-dideoxygalactose transaminase